jgi:hypothetical protein
MGYGLEQKSETLVLRDETMDSYDQHGQLPKKH